jgi:hypothetical protein
MSVLCLLFWYVHHNFKFDFNSLAYKGKKERNSEAPEKINSRYLTLFYHKSKQDQWMREVEKEESTIK